MELDPVGRVDDPAALDLEPLTLPVIGYHSTNRTESGEPVEVIERFRFRPVIPWGQIVTIYDAQVTGMMTVRQVAEFLHECLLDEEQERWREWEQRSDIVVDPLAMSRGLNQLMEVYNARPTMPRSASTGGGEPASPTTQAASRKRASSSRKKRPVSPATSSTPSGSTT